MAKIEPQSSSQSQSDLNDLRIPDVSKASSRDDMGYADASLPALPAIDPNREVRPSVGSLNPLKRMELIDRRQEDRSYGRIWAAATLGYSSVIVATAVAGEGSVASFTIFGISAVAFAGFAIGHLRRASAVSEALTKDARE